MKERDEENPTDSRSVQPSTKVEEYFRAYAVRASRMNGWQLEEEMARKLEMLDELNEAGQKEVSLIERTMREIEILQAQKKES